MSWIQKLFDTYEACCNQETLMTEKARLLPMGHTMQQAHIHVQLDNEGNFQGAQTLDKELIPLPATEISASRANEVAPHGLMDKIQYCAKDYDAFGGVKKSHFDDYEDKLTQWCTSPHAHRKATSVWRYIQKGTLVEDLVRESVLFVDEQGILRTSWDNLLGETPPMFKMLTKKKVGTEMVQDQGEALVCWSVNTPGEPQSETWTDRGLQKAWGQYLANQPQGIGLCYVTGKEIPLANRHPAKLRHSGDRAKLISANDHSGYTFRGRFTDKKAQQACGVGSEVTQKAHNALSWLIARQGIRSSDQVFVCWAVSGKEIPKPLSATIDYWGDEDFDEEVMPVASDENGPDHTRDAGQRFARKLKRFIQGYTKDISPTEQIIIMGLDSATPGRMSIIYYRELLGSEFFNRLEAWHESTLWWQRYSQMVPGNGKKKEKKQVTWPLSAPSPKAIAETAYGSRLDDKLKKATLERLVPCIMDGRQIPWDLVASCARRASNRVGMDHREWEKSVGVACALYRGFYIRHHDPEKRREYSMSLDETCRKKDYLYGRLLAIAEHMEEIALHAGGETRPTTAARLMQRFADRPFSTWATIEKALQPYIQRLHSKRAGFLVNMNRLLDEVHELFAHEDYTSDTALTGEYLLGYHCQRRSLKHKNEKNPSSDQGDAS